MDWNYLCASQMKKCTALSQLAMLGSHDSGTFGIEELKRYTVTQNLGVIGQAEIGVRYFDLRVRKLNLRWRFYHGEHGILTQGYTNHKYDALEVVKELIQ